jgi:hypothetical protein
MNADCSAPGLELYSLPAAIGFWRATNSSTTFYPCPLEEACAGNAIQSSNRDYQCAEGYVGVRCELCDTGKDYVKQVGGTCGSCADGGVMLTTVMPLLILIIFLVWFDFWLIKSDLVARCFGWESHEHFRHGLRPKLEKRAAKFRILVGFCQVFCRIPVSFRLIFPPQVVVFIEGLVVFEFIDIFRFFVVPNCLFKLTYYVKIVFVVCCPLCVAIIAYVLSGYACTKPRGKTKKITASKGAHSSVSGAKHKRQQWLFEVALLLAFVCFPSFCHTLFRYFDCQAYEDGYTYLVVDPSIECHDANYKAMAGVFAGPLAVLVPLAIVCFYVGELWRWRKQLCPAVSRPEDLDDSMLARIPSNALVASLHDIHAVVREAPKGQLAKDAMSAIVKMQACFRGNQSRLQEREHTIEGFITNMSEVAAKAKAKEAKTKRLSWREKKRKAMQYSIEKNKALKNEKGKGSTKGKGKLSRRASRRITIVSKVVNKVKKLDVQVGVSLAEVKAAFEIQEQSKGPEHAVRWLQLLARATCLEIRHLEFLFIAYRPEYYWFEAFELLRKVSCAPILAQSLPH